MKHVDYQLGVASKTKRPTAEERLNEASFLTIEPQGEVWTEFDSIYAVVDIASANEWSIAAHFPLSPSPDISHG